MDHKTVFLDALESELAFCDREAFSAVYDIGAAIIAAVVERGALARGRAEAANGCDAYIEHLESEIEGLEAELWQAARHAEEEAEKGESKLSAAVPPETELAMGAQYRITAIHPGDDNPQHKVGDVLVCQSYDANDRGPCVYPRVYDAYVAGEPKRCWFAGASLSGTYVTGLELVLP